MCEMQEDNKVERDSESKRQAKIQKGEMLTIYKIQGWGCLSQDRKTREMCMCVCAL